MKSKLIPTYRIFKANGDWMYDTTSLAIAKQHEAVGFTYGLLPNGFWVAA